MKSIKKIKIKNPEEVKLAIEKHKVIHVVPEIEVKDLEHFYFNIMCSLGKPFNSDEDFISKNKNGNLWSDIIYSKEKSSSFSYSNTRQPFHTDGAYESNSPDIYFFYCIKKSKFGGKTIFVDTKKIIEILEYHDKSFLKELKETKIKFSKGNDSKECFIIDEQENINWNYFRAEKNNTTEKFHIFLENFIFQGGIFESVCLDESEAVFFWDKKVLHGRNSFLGDRHLRKAGIYV